MNVWSKYFSLVSTTFNGFPNRTYPFWRTSYFLYKKIPRLMFSNNKLQTGYCSWGYPRIKTSETYLETYRGNMVHQVKLLARVLNSCYDSWSRVTTEWLSYKLEGTHLSTFRKFPKSWVWFLIVVLMFLTVTYVFRMLFVVLTRLHLEPILAEITQSKSRYYDQVLHIPQNHCEYLNLLCFMPVFKVLLQENSTSFYLNMNHFIQTIFTDYDRSKISRQYHIT